MRWTAATAKTVPTPSPNASTACARRAARPRARTTRLRIFFPHVLAQRTTQWERGDDPMTRFTFTDDYDAYGQPRSQIEIAVPRGRRYR